MPAKRRLRNGTASAGGASGKPPLAALAALQQQQQALQLQAQQQQALLQQQQALLLLGQQQQQHSSSDSSAGAGGDYNNGIGATTAPVPLAVGEKPASSIDIAAGGGGGHLTLKQQQQLERNQFLCGLTKDQLRVECRKRGQKTTGNKTELLQRLGFKMTVSQNAPTADGAKSAKQNGSAAGGGDQQTVVGRRSPNAAKPPQQQQLQRSKSAKAADRDRERAEREQLVLWRKPLQTLRYGGQEALLLLQTYGDRLLAHSIWIGGGVALVAALLALQTVDGWHQPLLEAFRANIGFVLYWVGLGVVSSVGLGTGLHTFLLYLGPHIASVTLAAYECNSLDFPSPPYPDEIICPENARGAAIPTLFAIMSKVRLEAFLWGAGTALGELPPYFMAKAARLSGYDPEDDDDLKEFEELQKKRDQGERLSLLDRAKVSMERIVERIGFFGILACASVPNPLFDLAGITCGHFLVPFWTFFGATLVGKAIIKMHIQKVFVIIAFNESLIERAVDLLGAIPVLGAKAQEPFKSFLKNQKARLHRGSSSSAAGQPRIEESGNLLAKCFELFVGAMVVYFVVSIVNSLAQSYHKRIHKKEQHTGGVGAKAKSSSANRKAAAKNK